MWETARNGNMQKAKVLTGFRAFEAPKSSYFHCFCTKTMLFRWKNKGTIDQMLESMWETARNGNMQKA